MAPRPRARRADPAGDPRARVAIPAPRPAVRAPRREEGRRARRLPREEVELRRRHDVVRRPAAQDFGSAAALRDADRRVDGARPAAADRACGGRRRRHRARRSCCGFWSRSRVRRSGPRPLRRRPRRAVLPAARRAGNGGADGFAKRRASPTSCPSSISCFPIRRRSSRRSIRRSIACWCGARSRCSTRGPASASPISFAGSAISRCRSHGAAPRRSASKAARRSCAAPRRSRR